MKISEMPLTGFDVWQSLDVVWAALFAFRENLEPEGDPQYDENWDAICTAMSWISEALEEAEGDERCRCGKFVQFCNC